MDNTKGRLFYEETNTINNIMSNFEFMNKQSLKLGRVECNLLQFLLEQNKPVTMKEIAEHIKVSHSRITHLMDSLIKKGYLSRIAGVEDRRVFYAEITPAGIEIAGRYKHKNAKTFEDFLEKLPQDQIEPILKTLKYWQKFLSIMTNNEISEEDE